PTEPAEHEIQVENKAIGINFIDTYIRSGLYPPPSLPAGLGTDLEMMPFLVAQANKKYPELNLKFVMSVHELVSSIKETRMEG
ncbi:YopJ family acetyltransferase, partial [Salmonella enterica subsp. enterica serovar Virginia]|nr:YopJ family acetyltransferase [Salmonella enterica subsp. enterica serovar Virginia]